MPAVLRARNFQSHDDTELEIDGLSVVVGASNSGKSALIRALDLLVNNSRSTAFVRQGEKAASVTLKTDDHTVSITRGPSKGEYVVDDSVYTKVGTVTLPAAEEALRLGRINFAGQFDRPYLLDASSTDVARELSALTEIDTLLAAAKEANRRHRALGVDKKAQQQLLASAREKLTDYPVFQERCAAFTQAETLSVLAADNITQAEKIEAALRIVNTATLNIEAITFIPLEDAEQALAYVDEAAEVYAKATAIQVAHNLVLKIQNQLKDAESSLLAYEGTATNAEMALEEMLTNMDVCPLCGRTA